jgi:uncharacterized protein YndB with AHSA1/START domain
MSDSNDRGRDEAGYALEIVRVFDAPRDLVYRAWTEPERMAQWAAPHGYTITHNEGEIRPGGAWRSCMRSPEGEDLWLGGVYREVIENELLVFTHAWDDDDGKPGRDTLVTVAFEDEEGATRMTFRQSGFESADDRDGHRGGWNESFERLAEVLSRSPGVGASPT